MKCIALQVHSVPPFGKGKSLVRFLGEPRGILTHYVKKVPRACPGEEVCDLHNIKAKWKGYAAGQLWDKDDRLWLPRVIELSCGLFESLGDEKLRGTCWELFRVERVYGKKAIEGIWRCHYDLHELPKPFDVQNTVESLYQTTRINWDVPIEGWTRDRAECSDDPPPAAPPPPPKPPVEDYAKVVERAKQQSPHLFGVNGTGKKTER